ncbi:unnamed protein product [Trifolium pratense]|uniref:Uncharacterized protein n=2 Tax=Trifolium pratense TaxID=57577 RepID=A0ACB0JF54_TRIPR|nr:unnamed protein product [Trifolium pratense]CAJ2656761.1 unnamed protein product [Trifolium pratense]
MLILLTDVQKTEKPPQRGQLDSGKILKKPQKKSNISNPSRKTSSSRTEEMQREVLEQERRRRSHSKASQAVLEKAKLMGNVQHWMQL